MSPLRIEKYITESNIWDHVADINSGDPDGTISANNPDGSRDIYLFGVDMINRQGFIKRSIAGIDIANAEKRAVNSLGFLTVATLNSNESYEIETVTDRSQGKSRRVRFVYLED